MFTIWELISSNRRKSMLIFFGLGFCLMLLAAGASLIDSYDNLKFFIPMLYFYGAIAIVLWIIISIISYFWGDSILLNGSDAHKIKEEDFPQLYNVAVEMKIAANLPVIPDVYVIFNDSPNAFATGRNPYRSAIAVTTGLIQQLKRDELQGVVAHEMAHIMNRDILLMTFAGSVLYTMRIIVEMMSRGSSGSSSQRTSSSNSSDGKGNALLLILGLILLIAAPLLGQIFYFSLSRKREYLADATAARITRYPEGLASALEKISAPNKQSMESISKYSAPLYIVSPLKNALSTHPPVEERIKILRSLGGSVSPKNYQTAYHNVTGKSGQLFPMASLLETPVSTRAPSQAAVKPQPELGVGARFLNDLRRKINNFGFIQCPCGVRMKVPPDYKKAKVPCPRCKRVHDNPVLT